MKYYWRHPTSDDCPNLQQQPEPGKMAAKAPVEVFSATFADRADASKRPKVLCRVFERWWSQVAGALWGMHIADAIAMPTHWYYGGEVSSSTPTLVSLVTFGAGKNCFGLRHFAGQAQVQSDYGKITGYAQDPDKLFNRNWAFQHLNHLASFNIIYVSTILIQHHSTMFNHRNFISHCLKRQSATIGHH